jgi:hypothetical protein
MGEQYHQVRLTDQHYGHAGRQGLAAAAHEAAGHGRGGDSFLVHVNANELAEMRQRWGEPTINPDTGQPEFFLGGIRDWFKDNPWASVALPVATSMLLPGLGSAVGSGINDGLGLGLSPGASNAVGGGLVGAGLGALTGGTRGALIGGALGAAVPYAQSGGFGEGLQNLTGGHVDDGGFNNEAARASMGLESQPQQPQRSGGALSNLFGGGGSGGGSGMGTMLPMLALAAMAGGSGGKSSSGGAPQMSPEQQAAVNQQNQHLRPVSFNRKYTPPTGDLTQYGYGGKQAGNGRWFEDNKLPAYAEGGAMTSPPIDDRGNPVTFTQGLKNFFTSYGDPGRMQGRGSSYATEHRQEYDQKRVEGARYARGGEPQGALAMASHAPSRYVAGPGDGRSDVIDAKLSNGEYVFDAESTALLGNGSSDAGARVLDQFRENLRKHKGKALAKGKFSPDAKRPEQYLPKGAK